MNIKCCNACQTKQVLPPFLTIINCLSHPSDVPSSNVDPLDQLGQGIPVVDGTDMSDTVTRVHHHPSDQSLGVECQHRLRGKVDRVEPVPLEHHLHIEKTKMICNVHFQTFHKH